MKVCANTPIDYCDIIQVKELLLLSLDKSNFKLLSLELLEEEKQKLFIHGNCKIPAWSGKRMAHAYLYHKTACFKQTNKKIYVEIAI